MTPPPDRIPEPTPEDLALSLSDLASLYPIAGPDAQLLTRRLAAAERRSDAAESRLKIADEALVSIQVYCQSCTDAGLRGLIQQVLDNLPWLREDVTRFVSETKVLTDVSNRLAAAESRARAAGAERDKLQAFKDWVHAYLDSHGVPHHPPGAHGAHGCRIGDRMDWWVEWWVEKLKAAEAERDEFRSAGERRTMERDAALNRVVELEEQVAALAGR
jgi:hypothetical protein